MTGAHIYSALADFVLALHTGFVAFVTLGLICILLGGFRGWSWVRNPWFRVSHLAAIGLVVIQSWLGVVCPLTTLEMSLREKAGDLAYGGTFMAHWLQRWLYYQAPEWLFAVAYTVFGLFVAASWLRFPPKPFRGGTKTAVEPDKHG